MVVEAALLWPRVRGVLEQLVAPEPIAVAAPVPAGSGA